MMFMYCCNTPILSNYRKITYQSTGNSIGDIENNGICKVDPKNKHSENHTEFWKSI